MIFFCLGFCLIIEIFPLKQFHASVPLNQNKWLSKCALIARTSEENGEEYDSHGGGLLEVRPETRVHRVG